MSQDLRPYTCLMCTYIYYPKDHDNVPFPDLPEDYECPVCGAGKEDFEAIEI